MEEIWLLLTAIAIVAAVVIYDRLTSPLFKGGSIEPNRKKYRPSSRTASDYLVSIDFDASNDGDCGGSDCGE